MAEFLNEAPPWNLERCKLAVLWHGCTELDRQGIEARGVDLSLSRTNLDFGRGFYTTTLQRQAEHWAFRRFESRSVPKQNNRAVVLKFALPRVELAALKSLNFVLANYDDEDYWSFVQHCRRSLPDSKRVTARSINDHVGPVLEGGLRWFDLVSGPVVADWKQRAVFQGMDQFSFHTASALRLLDDAVKHRNAGRYSWQLVQPK